MLPAVSAGDAGASWQAGLSSGGSNKPAVNTEVADASTALTGSMLTAVIAEMTAPLGSEAPASSTVMVVQLLWAGSGAAH